MDNGILKTDNGILTLGSLFDGIGGFPFAATLAGVKTIWASEIDPACIAVTKKHFPEMEHLGNIMGVDGAKIMPVDIISFGSPCQDLSVAGKQAGIHGERSGLFKEAIRIVYEMRAATNGKYPTFVIWENVPGAFSSNRGFDFRTVLEEITKTDIPMPGSGKWATAGVVRGGAACVAWRQLDAQYWGVPQRRKRIYLVGSFGSNSAEEILFKRDGVRRYLTQSGTQRERTTFNAERSIAVGGECFDARGNGGGKIAPTITGDHNCRINDYCSVLCQKMFVFDETQITSPQNGNNPKPNNPCHTLAASGNPPVLCIQGRAIGRKEKNEQNGNGINEDISFTLNTVDQHAVCYGVFKKAICLNDQGGNSIAVESEEVSPTLRAQAHGNLPIVCYQGEKTAGSPIIPINTQVALRHKALGERTGFGVGEAGDPQFTLLSNHHHAVCMPIYSLDYASFNQGKNTLFNFDINDSEINSTLVAKGPSAVAYKFIEWIIRRLTPLECERLQGFPDRWTELPKIKDMSDEEYSFFLKVFVADKAEKDQEIKKQPTKSAIIKWYNKLDCDGSRYRMCGNSLAIPCAFYVLCGIADYVKREQENGT